MSLRTVHLVFITLSTLVSFFFGVWAVMTGLSDQHALLIIGGLAAFVVGTGLILYGVAFRRKTRHMA